MTTSQTTECTSCSGNGVITTLEAAGYVNAYCTACDGRGYIFASVNAYPLISTRELLQINATFVREWQADPTDSNRRAVILTGAELTRRGA